MTKKHILTILLIIAGVAIIGFFGMRAFRAYKHMEGHGPFNGKPPAANQTDISSIRDWMTVPYISHMYNVPQDLFYKTLELPKDDKNDKMSLAQLNKKYYPDQDGVVLAHVQAVIQALQKQERPPHFPATPISVTPTATP
ncbi:MAG: hypothetical protein U0Z26_04375 [Anaerolineales bacterium]